MPKEIAMLAWLRHEDRRPIYDGFREGAYKMGWFMIAMIMWYIMTSTGQSPEQWLREVGWEGWMRMHLILALMFILSIVT